MNADMLAANAALAQFQQLNTNLSLSPSHQFYPNNAQSTIPLQLSPLQLGSPSYILPIYQQQQFNNGFYFPFPNTSSSP